MWLVLYSKDLFCYQCRLVTCARLLITSFLHSYFKARDST